MANRFIFTFFIAVSLYISAVFLSFLFFRPHESEIVVLLLVLLLVAIVLAVISGIIASLVPINNKVVFVIAGISPILLFVWNYIMAFRFQA